MVVGLSNTAGDVCVDLCGVAEKVYVSHRSGARIVSGHPKQSILDTESSRCHGEKESLQIIGPRVVSFLSVSD